MWFYYLNVKICYVEYCHIKYAFSLTFYVFGSCRMLVHFFFSNELQLYCCSTSAYFPSSSSQQSTHCSTSTIHEWKSDRVAWGKFVQQANTMYIHASRQDSVILTQPTQIGFGLLTLSTNRRLVYSMNTHVISENVAEFSFSDAM